ncbi:YggT family protein [Levilinea saccharolytica]|uniref:YggT family protein n=1 Tax=Levilinea saccharolytica TaxID=229921 RepID=A0A0P6YPU9_9CHLR|nr:YggT family protein [Levilinea saccharolytica]KPL85013.1 hypothetical protein ADN01_06460 [Levilinea saccharolytica]GAP18115.1 YGGT family [Levilinea saccharolytica]
MVVYLITFINLLARAIFLLVLAEIVLSYFLPPYHNVRVIIGRFTNPMLDPIRKLVRPIQGIDFSPLILVILVQIVEFLLVSLLRGLG